MRRGSYFFDRCLFAYFLDFRSDAVHVGLFAVLYDHQTDGLFGVVGLVDGGGAGRAHKVLGGGQGVGDGLGFGRTGAGDGVHDDHVGVIAQGGVDVGILLGIGLLPFLREGFGQLTVIHPT